MNKLNKILISMISSGMFLSYPTLSFSSSPFSPLPLHLSNKTDNSKVAPNVLFILDNSGSMVGVPETEDLMTTKEYAINYCKNFFAPALGIFTGVEVNEQYGSLKCKYNNGSKEAVKNFRFCSPKGWGTMTGIGFGPHSNVGTCQLPPEQRESRIEILKRVMTEVISQPENKNVRWGISYINKTAYNNADDVYLSDNNRAETLSSIKRVEAWGGTPLTEAYNNAIYDNYIINDNIQYRCQPNFTVLFTDGFAAGYPGSMRTPVRDWISKNWMDTNISYDKWSSKVIEKGKTYHPYFNQVHYEKSLTDLGANGLSATSKIFAEKDLRTSGVDKEGVSWNDPSFFNGKQTVSTSTIGFDVKNSYLINGAQGYASNFYEAKNADDLSNALKSVLFIANKAGKGVASVTPSVSLNNTKYGALSLSLDLANGNSVIKFLDLNRNKNTDELDSVDNKKVINYGKYNIDRKVIITKKNHAPKYLNQDDIDWNNVSESDKKNYHDWLVRKESSSDTQLNTNVPNLRSRDSGDALKSERMMGDVIGSNLLQVDMDNNKSPFAKYLVTSSNDGMIHIFSKNENNNTNPYSLKLNWIVGSGKRENNNTIWDAIYNTTQKDYITSQLNPHVYLLNGGISYRKTYGGQIFAVGSLGQGGKGAYAFNIGGNQHNNQSEKVGIDSEDSKWHQSVPLWETSNVHFGTNDLKTQQENAKLGYTVGTPVIDRMAMVRVNGKPAYNNPIYYVSAVNNGYYGAEDVPSLYIYNVLGQHMTYQVDNNGNIVDKNNSRGYFDNSGKLIAKIKVPSDSYSTGKVTGMLTDNGVNEMNNGLSSPTLVDLDYDGLADIAYAGDLKGNMYRFDFRKNNPDSWDAVRIFKGNKNNPITAAPAIVRKTKGNSEQLVVLFGTGKDLHTEDLKDKNQQFFYGIYDDLSKCVGNNADCQQEVTFENINNMLQKYEISSVKSTQINNETKEVRFTKEINSIDKPKGWVLELKENTGERVTVQPTVVNNSVFFTTREYSNNYLDSHNVCVNSDNSGTSWLMGLNAITGENLSKKVTNIGYFKENNQNSYYSGLKLQGIASATGFLKSLNETEPYSRNEQGQVQNGYDKDLHNINGNEHIIKSCGGSPGDLILSDSKTDFISIKLTNKKCGVKRLTWREIFW